eukprot:355021-Chlamydomonas_euryale.AAC.7
MHIDNGHRTHCMTIGHMAGPSNLHSSHVRQAVAERRVDSGLFQRRARMPAVHSVDCTGPPARSGKIMALHLAMPTVSRKTKPRHTWLHSQLCSPYTDAENLRSNGLTGNTKLYGTSHVGLHTRWNVGVITELNRKQVHAVRRCRRAAQRPGHG